MRSRTIKIIAIFLFSGIAIAGGVAYYMFNMPPRDVQASATDFNLTSSAIVKEYLNNEASANDKYLHDEGNSKILAVTGIIFSVDTDQNNQRVILLKDSTERAGVSCTFTETTNSHADNLKIGQTITIKGVIRSGAGFDQDLDMYEDVIMEKCDIIN